MKGIIFFDVDGTTVDSEHGQSHPSESVVNAIHEAQSNGHLCMISTGRNLIGVSALESIGMDGYILSDGAAVIAKDRESLFHPITDVKVAKLIRQVTHDYRGSLLLATLNGAYATEKSYNHTMKSAKRLAEAQNIPLEDILKEFNLKPLEEYAGEDILEIDVDFPNTALKDEWCRNKDPELKFILTNSAYGTKAKASGEVTMRGVSKAAACREIVQMFGGDMEHTIAFGDSMNDGEMLRECHIGIAMGNSPRELKDIADDVTDTIQDDGVVKGLRKYGIIK